MAIDRPAGAGPRVLVATDLPFWRRASGAAKRIEALLAHVIRLGCPVRVFYLGEWIAGDEVAGAEWNVMPARSEEPPREWGARLRWEGEAIRHWWRGGSPTGPRDGGPARLADFQWWWAAQKFAELVREERPDVVLIEYVTLAYLLDRLRPQERAGLIALLDSHDLLHERASQFAARGFPHWLDISATEEAEAAARFDWILAIQEEEAEAFRALVPEVRVARVGHAISGIPAEPPPRTQRESGNWVIGYLGSLNDSNLAGMEWFLGHVWPLLRERVPGTRLRIAGEIGTALADRMGECGEGVEWLGRIDDPSRFLTDVDVMVNPVTFGTGLKIKNVEALAHGRPLVTTPAGWEGLPRTAGEGVQIAGTGEEMVSAIERLLTDSGIWDQASRDALQFAEREFSIDRAYSELNSILFGI